MQKSKLKFYKILKKIKLKCLQIIYNTKASHIGSIFFLYGYNFISLSKKLSLKKINQIMIL